MNLKINDEVKSILRLKGIPVKDGVSFLLSLYFNSVPSYVTEDFKRKIYSTNIITIDFGEHNKVITWSIPLFEGQQNNFDWLKEYMDLFKQVNPERRGLRSHVEKRMKELFSTNPDIRKEEVIEATKYYLSKVDNPTYCLYSHKFISNTNGTPLLDYIKELRENKRSSNNNPFNRII